MTAFFPNSDLLAGGASLHCVGGLSPQLVNAIYPMEALTKWHYGQHLPGLTGRWMDTGSTKVGGAVRGSFHRIAHGHHALEDGYRVLVNPNLKFGHFLHHIGLDSLTARGIPNPLIPTAVGQQLIKLGLSKQFVHELVTVNLPKILGGSLAVICAGNDALACFSDAIPHTFLAAGKYFGLGTLDILLGLYPAPNVFLLSAGAMEIGVGGVAAYRAFIDPILPVVNVPASVFLPALGQTVALAAVIGACVSIFTGKDWRDVPKTIAASAVASSVSTTVTFMAAGGGFLAPFIGPVAGIATYFIMKKVFDSLNADLSFGKGYQEYGANERLLVFDQGLTIPLFGIPAEPIGTFKKDTLVLSEKAMARQHEFWIQK
jgi:hypothetical protein